MSLEDPSTEEANLGQRSREGQGEGKRETPSSLASCLPLLKAGGDCGFGERPFSKYRLKVTLAPDPVGLAGTVLLSRLILKQN